MASSPVWNNDRLVQLQLLEHGTLCGQTQLDYGPVVYGLAAECAMFKQL